MTEILGSFLHYVVKILLTGGLLFVIVLCGILMFRLWFERTLVLNPFEHLSATEASSPKGQYFTRLLSENLQELRALYSGQPIGRLTDEAPLLPSTDQVGRGLDITLPSLPSSPFSAIDIRAYGVQVSTLLTDLWRWIERPRAIEGKFWDEAGELRVRASLSQAAGSPLMRWDLSERDIENASAELACRILHFLLSSPARRTFYDTTTLEFCLFTRAWHAYQRYRSRLIGFADSNDTKAALEEASSLIDRLNERQAGFPFVPKLAARIRDEQGRRKEALELLDDYITRIGEYDIEDPEAEEFKQSILESEAPRAQTVVSAAELGLQGMMRPLRPGSSVGSETTTAGTICCFVREDNGDHYILSADHSMPDEPGANVLQPGPIDGGTVADNTVATISRIKQGEPDIGNTAAGAIAELLPGIEFEQTIPKIGPITGVASKVELGETVRAVGRTSGLTRGVVRAIGITVHISFGPGDVRRFDGLIEVSPISAAGDSGAPVLNERAELIGMVYAGSHDRTLVMPIEPVLEALDVSLVAD